jgi:lipoprotein-anchoring transpeptidase ErfK/SrfK
MMTKKKKTAANGLATHAHAVEAHAAMSRLPATPAPEAVRRPALKKAAVKPAPTTAPKAATAKAPARAKRAKAKAAPSKKQPKTMRSASPAPPPAAVADELPPMPMMPVIAGEEQDFLVEVNNIMSVLRAGLTALPEPEDPVQRLQALYFGFLNTTVQLALDLAVPLERSLEDMAECLMRAEHLRASEAEYLAQEQAQQQHEQSYQGG